MEDVISTKETKGVICAVDVSVGIIGANWRRL